MYKEKEKDVANGALGLFIGKFPAGNGSISVKLKIDGKDTVFKYNMKACNCDSLMMGYSDLGYFVVMNENEYPWFDD